jgi:hypothetical protein
LEKKKKIFYPNWRKAGKAALKLGINGSEDYGSKYKLDPMLPGDPNRTYADFPGWKNFFVKKMSTLQPGKVRVRQQKNWEQNQ